MMAGEPVKIAVTPTNFNPKRTLTYTWSSTGGKVAGNDASTTVDTNGACAGQLHGEGEVSDNRKKNPAVAECSAQFTINEPPKHPPTISCAAQPDHGPRRRSGQPDAATGNSPDGRPLTYTHTATAGKLTPNGATATLDTTGVSAGSGHHQQHGQR